MNIVFMHVGEDISLPIMMTQSAEAYGYKCIQLTDESSPVVPGCEVGRLQRNPGEGLMFFRARCYAAYNQPGIYMDTDMLVRHDLDPIMALDFDVALTKRSNIIKDPSGHNLTAEMPYNGGFVAVRNPTFWPKVWEIMNQQHPDLQEWYGDQFAIAEAAARFRVLELPWAIYNRTVTKTEQKVDMAWVLHFKGKGKEVMPWYAASDFQVKL